MRTRPLYPPRCREQLHHHTCSLQHLYGNRTGVGSAFACAAGCTCVCRREKTKSGDPARCWLSHTTHTPTHLSLSLLSSLLLPLHGFPPSSSSLVCVAPRLCDNADDLGMNDVGYMGQPEEHRDWFIPTSAIDQLSGQGVRLTNFYVHPSCSPTRAALLTGRYAHNNGFGGPAH